MAICRCSPGEIVPASGTWALVGHYGEATDFAVVCDKGGRLPLVILTCDIDPVWFVRVDEVSSSTLAA